MPCIIKNTINQSSVLEKLIRYTLRQLEYFVATVQHGSTQQAAVAMNVSQPSISQAVTALEAAWGVRLFFRMPSLGLQPTRHGKLRFQQAQQLLMQAEALGRIGGKQLDGKLAVGCLSTLGPMYFPALMRRFTDAYPKVRMTFNEADTASLLAHIERDSLDLALVYDTGLFHRCRLHHLGALHPYLLMQPGHPFAAQNAVDIRSMEDMPFILINLPHSREYFLSLFTHENIKPKIVAETQSIEMARGMVAHGYGLCILVTRPPGDQSYDGKPIVCRPLTGPVQPQNIALASSPDLQLSPTADAFLSMARKYFETLKNHNPV